MLHRAPKSAPKGYHVARNGWTYYYCDKCGHEISALTCGRLLPMSRYLIGGLTLCPACYADYAPRFAAWRQEWRAHP